jgi:alkylation response protein AidB-like acyl-CoA dehydrogenase
MTETMRKVPVAVIAALAVQTAGALVWAGGAAARISVLEGRMGEHRQVAERLARLEEQSKATRAVVERIELRLERGR